MRHRDVDPIDGRDSKAISPSMARTTIAMHNDEEVMEDVNRLKGAKAMGWVTEKKPLFPPTA